MSDEYKAKLWTVNELKDFVHETMHDRPTFVYGNEYDAIRKECRKLNLTIKELEEEVKSRIQSEESLIALCGKDKIELKKELDAAKKDAEAGWKDADDLRKSEFG